MSNPSYQPPRTLWEVSRQLRFDEPLEATDPRFVDTRKARGNFKFDGLLKRLGIDPSSMEFKIEPDSLYIVFCGHRGCGKSTELRRLNSMLNAPDKYCVIFLDAVRQLDPNNLQYPDVLFALAKELLERLEREGIIMDAVFLERLEDWFKEHVESYANTKDLAAEVKADISVGTGVPFLVKIFASFTNWMKVNSTYKEELRRALKNSFSVFADAFNQLLVEAEFKLKKWNKGRKLLFMVDGTDRLTGEDSKRFFVTDVHQLQLIQGNFIYCAPIHMIHEDNYINQAFSRIIKLPMIKLSEKGSDVPLPEGCDAMRQMIYRRADRALFDSEATVDYLIKYSGGHPRDLLRLLNYAFEFAEGDVFDRAAAQKAVKQLATDYRRILETKDYKLLRGIDQAPADQTENSKEVQHLLFNLALLEYNEYWWQSHPVIRTLPEYQAAAQS